MSSWHWSHSSLHAPLALPDCLPGGDHLGGGAGRGSDANNQFSCHNVEPLAAPAWENTEIPRRGNITIIWCCSTMIIILQQLLFFLSRLSHSNGTSWFLISSKAWSSPRYITETSELPSALTSLWPATVESFQV